MPTSDEARPIDAEALFSQLNALLKVAIKQKGFTSTLRSLQKGRLPGSTPMTVSEGFVEEQPSGLYDAALQTEQGRVVLRNAQRTDRPTDSQAVPNPIAAEPELAVARDHPATSADLLQELRDAGLHPSCRLVCELEITHFDEQQRVTLLPLLWAYIREHKNSNDPELLVAVGSAIRKYAANMSMDRSGELAELLEPVQRMPLPLELELEVAKMIYRNFEAHPPEAADPQPELGARLWEMAQTYSNPRILLRDKHSAVASLAIEALVAMRSSHALAGWRLARACPYRWFGEMVTDDLSLLRQNWTVRSHSAAEWLDNVERQLEAEM